jgi:hypothetical protein
VQGPSDTPIFARLLTEAGERRRAAEAEVNRLGSLVADVEALHEPDRYGNCPTCQTEAPCATLQLVHDELDLDGAMAAVRGEIDIAAYEHHQAPPVPKLADLLAVPAHGMDRFFESLLGPDQGPRRASGAG